MDWAIYFVQGIELLFLGTVSYYDLKTKEIPVELFVIFGILAVGCNAFWAYQSLDSVIAGCMIGLFFVFIGWITEEQIGYGDGIGMIVLGILTGGRELLVIIFIACIFCAVYGLWSLLGLKKPGSDTLPFFPFLFLSAMGVILL